MLLRIALDMLLVGAGLAVLILLFQTKVIFPATRAVGRTPKDAYGWDYEEVRLPVLGHETHAWFIPVANARGTVLFSHGNAESVADVLESVAMFRELGLDALVYDYGGYGYSTGRPSEQRCYQDIRAMWRYLTEKRGVAPSTIVLFGRSLGGAVTADLAAEVQPAAVILESTFLSAPEMAKRVLPVLPIGWLIRHRFETAKKIARFSSPVLITHSPDDTMIPFEQGRELFRLAPEPKQFLEIRGDHNEGYILSRNWWMEGVNAFLTPLLDEKSAGALRSQ